MGITDKLLKTEIYVVGTHWLILRINLQCSAQDAPLRHLRKKKSRGRKKIQLDGPEGAPNFPNQKTTKSNFLNIVLVF